MGEQGMSGSGAVVYESMQRKMDTEKDVHFVLIKGLLILR